MIYATVMPVEKYVVQVDGHDFGLYSSYKYFPALLALVLIGTPLAYDYEGCRPTLKRRVELDDVDGYIQILKSNIDGKTLEELLISLTPLEFYTYIKEKDLSDIPMFEAIMKIDQGTFKFIVGARAAAWALHYRGKLPSVGKVFKVNFGGPKTVLNVTKSMMEMHYELKKKLMYEE